MVLKKYVYVGICFRRIAVLIENSILAVFRSSFSAQPYCTMDVGNFYNQQNFKEKRRAE